MLCFLLVNFIEDKEIHGLPFFKRKSKLRLSLLISIFINDHPL